MKTAQHQAVITSQALRTAAIEGLRRMAPSVLMKNPIMASVALGAVLTTVTAVIHAAGGQPFAFAAHVSFWLWFTVWSSTTAESLAEGRGKARASALRGGQQNVQAVRIVNGIAEHVEATTLVQGDVIRCDAGSVIPVDGEVILGMAMVDESAITGESAPVLRAAGGDRSAVTGGTTVRSDSIDVRVVAAIGSGFVDRLIKLIEQAHRQPTPNERALQIVLLSLSSVFLVVVAAMPILMSYAGVPASATTGIVGLVALFVCLIPTTIGGLLPAIGIAGMDRLIARNVVALSGRAIEAAGDADVLLLDKTGTITYGNRRAASLIPAHGVDYATLEKAVIMASVHDDTPEADSIRDLVPEPSWPSIVPTAATPIPFSAHSRISGTDVNTSEGTVSYRKGAVDAIVAASRAAGNTVDETLLACARDIARQGATPLLVSRQSVILGLVDLRDTVKPGIRERLQKLRSHGIRSIMITGDNPLTAAAIAAQAGVDDTMAEATPDDKLARIVAEQREGRLVAMIGDGTNDAPALAQADVGIAMVSGTQAAREAASMIDLDNDPTKILDVVDVGKQLLRTRGALTTFSIANDVSKYVAILPAMFVGMWPTLLPPERTAQLNVLGLSSPENAILAAVIFNALAIGLLVPLAMAGNREISGSPERTLRRNLLVYGLGGIVAPFPSITLIDMILQVLL